MRFSSVSAVLIGVALLSACSDSASSDDLRRIPESYAAPPAPCDRGGSGEAVIALRWRRTPQTYVLAGREPSALELDYEVHPAAHVDVLRLGLTLADPVPPRTLEGECPRRLDVAGLRSWVTETSPVPGDVGRVVVVAENDRRSRRGEVSFTTGSRELSVRLPDLEAHGEELPTWPTWVAFEPAWGAARLAVQAVEPEDWEAGTITLVGLPAGPGTALWVELPEEATDLDREGGVAYLPTHFSDDWTALATRWRVALLGSEDSEVAPAIGVGVTHQPAVLRPDLELPDVGALVLVGAERAHRSLPLEGTPPPHQGTVSAPCGEPLRVTSAGRARVRIHDLGAAGSDPVSVAPGGTATVEPICDAEAAMVGVEVLPLAARDALVIVERASSEVLP